MGGRPYQQRRLQLVRPCGHAHHALEATLRVKTQSHRVFDAKLKVHRQHHAPVCQRQRCIAHQIAGVPQPRQRQRTHSVKCQCIERLRAATLAQMQDAAGRPAPPTGGNDEKVHPLLGIHPGHRVSQAPQAIAQLVAHGVAVHHKTRLRPGAAGAVKLRRRNLHLRPALALAGKPKHSQCRRAVRRHHQQAAGMGRCGARGHGYHAPLHHDQGCGLHGFASCTGRGFCCQCRCSRLIATHKVQRQHCRQGCKHTKQT